MCPCFGHTLYVTYASVFYPSRYQTEVVKTPPEFATATAGSISRQQRLAAADGTQGDMSDTLQVLPTDSEITLRVFVDRTLVEVPAHACLPPANERVDKTGRAHRKNHWQANIVLYSHSPLLLFFLRDRPTGWTAVSQ